MSAPTDITLSPPAQAAQMGLKSIPAAPPGLTRRSATTSPAAPPSPPRPGPAPDASVHAQVAASDSQNEPDGSADDTSTLSRSSSAAILDTSNAPPSPSAFALLATAPVDMKVAEAVVGICRPPAGETPHYRNKRGAQERVMTATVLTAVVQHSSAVRADLEKLRLSTNVQAAEMRRAKELLSKLSASPTSSHPTAAADCRKAIDDINGKVASF